MKAEDKKQREIEARRRISQMPDPVAMLQDQASRYPDREAFVHLRHADDIAPRIYRYAQAADIAARFAGALVSAGITESDTVAIVAPSLPETLLALAGTASVAIAFPLNLLLSAEALAAQLRFAHVKAIVAFGAHPAMKLAETVAQAVRIAGVDIVIEIDAGHGASAELAQCSARHFRWDDFLATGDPTAIPAVSGARPAFLFHTGGTTGAPKLAELSLDAVMASIHTSSVGIGWRDGERILQLFPFFHVGGAFIVGLGIFSAGATLMNCSIAGARDPDTVAALWQIAARMKTNIIALAPASWSQIAAQGEPSARWPELRSMFTGAASIPAELVDRLVKLVGVPMVQGLGMTEMSGAGAYQVMDGVMREQAVGYPAPLLEARLVPIAPDAPHELYVRGPMLFSGYRTVDGLVDGLTDGWYASGDLAEFLPDGQLKLLGRAKDVIIRGGHNIDPLAIEDVVARHPDIVIAAAVAMPDAFAGELPIVYAVRKPGAKVSEAELLAFVGEGIDEPPARPKRVIFVDDLPLTLVGKIARYQLRQKASAMRMSELLQGVAGIDSIYCDDLGARRITVAWTAGAATSAAPEADAIAATLGLTIVHKHHIS
ncbi:AMP-binding protein [Sphingobium boeckii]|uniref:Fatty-acyl-CoA synthase n=1 Tax=Sphingobium boeckii TaxID=1082345 RepID=A0A7W9EE00_9SPHN|nr:AMP-binding protein [Sphingobium boeckii]MBB5685667.1 fatty-acyl-CoA synthase [Sphingobium boeckii]